ncbi:MAG TPA: hypothetical protein VM470_09970, partial [Acidimicrobiia bacterium]|nr:hypothetical protein [Acidimicrobiia bacterium]
DGDRVKRILVKPDNPPSNLMWACAVAYRGALDGLADFEYPGELFDRLCDSGDVAGIHLSNSYLEIGTVESLEAVRALPGAFPA